MRYDRNPWFRDFWEQHFDCVLPRNGTEEPAAGPTPTPPPSRDGRPLCPSDLKLGPDNDYFQEGQVRRTEARWPLTDSNLL